MRRAAYWLLQETTDGGEPKEPVQRVDYGGIHTAVWLRAPRMPARNLRHFLALAAASPGFPVVLNYWETVGWESVIDGGAEFRKLAFSAFLTYVPAQLQEAGALDGGDESRDLVIS